MLCVCVGDVMDVVFSVCIVMRGSVSVSSCRFCMFVSCVHHVAVLNAAFYMTCCLLMLVEDSGGDHMEELQKTQPTCGGADPVVWQTLCKLCLPLPPPVMVDRLPFFGQAGHADPLDGWQCSS